MNSSILYRQYKLEKKKTTLGGLFKVALKTVFFYGIYLAFTFSIPAYQHITSAASVDIKEDIAVIGESKIKIEFAESQRERIQGLSGRSYLNKNSGMLFVFDKKDKHGIWMKDMKFSLDVLWLNGSGEVIYIERNISPDTYPTTFYPNSNAKYVLELNSGFVSDNSIKIGDKLQVL